MLQFKHILYYPRYTKTLYLKEFIMKIYMALLFLVTVICADTNQTKPYESSYVDITHDYLSNKVIRLSESIDMYISDTNETKEEQYYSKSTDKSVDAYFKSEKFKNETKDTYVNIEFSTTFQSKEDESYKPGISARIPLSRSKKNIKLYIDNISHDKDNEIVENIDKEKHSTPEIGVSFFSRNKLDIDSKYSLGTRGFNPFAKARYSINFYVGKWIIEPAQTFKLSTNDKFEEETILYFDRKINKTNLFRIALDRKTKSEEDGMSYTFATHYYWFTKKRGGLNISQTLSGNTKYKDVKYNAKNQDNAKIYDGINNYETAISWRDNIWKQWLFYEIRPSVNFHKKHDFEANYAIKFTLDYYIGHLRK